MFLLGQTVSNVGSSFTIFVLPLLVFKLTGSAFNLALVASAEYIPYLLFGLIIGAWVDRVDRRRLMILTDIAQALVISSIPLLGALGLLSVWWIYAVGFVSSTLWIFFNTAEFAAVPSLVPEEDLPAADRRRSPLRSSPEGTRSPLAGPLQVPGLVQRRTRRY
jgi:MFS family permease